MPVPTIEQKLSWLKPSPPTDHELKCAEAVKVGSYEIGFQRTNDILDEAMEVFQRSCRSSFGVAGDSLVALFSASGDLVNGASGTYIHAIIPPIVIKYIIANYGESMGISDGDIWVFNDALYGGIHNPDVMICMPIVHQDSLIGWAAALTHTAETGAKEPGGMTVSATSRFDEGMNLPPMKVGENFQLRPDIEEVFSAFGIRSPQIVVVDLKARCTAADRLRRRIVEMCDKEGQDFVVGLFGEMLRRAEHAARKRISSWPDGSYRCVNFSDAFGTTQGLIRSCSLTLTKRGDTLTFDFEGTSPENPSSYNAHPQAALAHATNFIYEYVFHDLPISNGTLASIDWKFPKGSCLSPSDRAATSCSPMIATGVMSAVHNCFAKMMFSGMEWGQATASLANAGNSYVIAGISQWGTPFVDLMAHSLNTEGQGGRATGDGIDAFGFPWCAFGRAPDVEMMENEAPILIPSSQYWPDSFGHGKYRGGAGTVQLWLAHNTSTVYFTSIGDNSKIQTPQPLFGGYAPCTIPGIGIRNADLARRMLNGTAVDLDVDSILRDKTIAGDWETEPMGRGVRGYAEDDVITFGFSAGGAGYGDPLDREPEAVLKDVRDGFLSPQTARDMYKVVCDFEAGHVDQPATSACRAQARTERIRQGRSYDAFVAEWQRRSPPSDIMQWFGSWPEGKVVSAVIHP